MITCIDGEAPAYRELRLIALGLCFVVSVAAADTIEVAQDIRNMSWLQGEWIGEGQDGERGEVEGLARQYWAPPREGSMSYLFAWHVAETGHVHYALTVFEQADDRVIGRGIHYGPDFETFEEQPWRLRGTEISADKAAFECVEYCRAAGVSFLLRDDGTLEERWRIGAEHADTDWIVRYTRKGMHP